MTRRRIRGRRRGLAGALISVILLALLAAVTSLLVEGDESSPAEQPQGPAALQVALTERHGGLYVEEPGRLQLARVERIIDGDTLDVTVAGETQRVRLFGVDAVERGERCYAEATNALRAVAGSEVRLLADRRREDQFGRWLRYLFTPEGRSIDAVLIASGAAKSWRDDGAYRDLLGDLEDETRQAGVGCLWS